MRSFHKMIYYCCYLSYKKLMCFYHPLIKDLWYRNSFFFGYWKFLESDIDITIVLENADKEQIRAISKSHEKIRRLFPVIGEIMIYSEAHAPYLAECVNVYELRRDPILVQKYQLAKAEDPYEKIIFLHKFLTSNWNKKNLDQSRTDKIAYYCKHMGLARKNLFVEMVNELAKLIGVDENEFQENYQAQMEFKKLRKAYSFPNIIYSLFYNNLCYLKPSDELNNVERNILEKALLWELWGSFTHQAILDPNELQMHFKRILEHLDQLTTPGFRKNYIRLASSLGLLEN